MGVKTMSKAWTESVQTTPLSPPYECQNKRRKRDAIIFFCLPWAAILALNDIFNAPSWGRSSLTRVLLAIASNYQPVQSRSPSMRLIDWSVSRNNAELYKTRGLFPTSFCITWKKLERTTPGGLEHPAFSRDTPQQISRAFVFPVSTGR